MKPLNKIFIILLLAITYTSCDDILEEDITDDMITIISPQNDTEIESNVVTFRWNEIKGADDYRVQVFSSSGQNVILDSLVNKSNFTYAINPGSYSWRIRGENFAYKTAYTFPVNFKVIATEDLSNQQVILNSPSENFYSNNPLITFSWAGITNADSYNFELINVTNGNSVVVPQTNIETTSYTLPANTITQDGQYKWRVNANNSANGTYTQFSSRNFYLDKTPPNNPQNSLPINDAVLADNQLITFEWTTVNDTGTITSAIVYIIEISSDSSFSNIISTATVSNNSYQYTFTTAGNYYWRLRAKDMAGNYSGYSNYTKIVIQ